MVTSTAEAEFVALANSSKTLFVVSQMTGDVIRTSITLDLPTVYTDSSSAKSLTEKQFIAPKLRHVDISFCFARQMVSEQKLKIEFVPGEDQTADLLTKALGGDTFFKHRRKLVF